MTILPPPEEVIVTVPDNPIASPLPLPMPVILIASLLGEEEEIVTEERRETS
jgi:hypothetical protein